MKYTMDALKIISLCLIMSACLKTRSEVRDSEYKVIAQEQVVNAQKSQVDSSNKFAEIEEKMREMTGQIEVLENDLKNQKLQNENTTKETESQKVELNKKIIALQEEVERLAQQNVALEQVLNQQKTEEKLDPKKLEENETSLVGKASTEPASGSEIKKSSFDIANDYYNKKDWKKSILLFQKYRDENPKGNSYSEATYKMGIAFNELGLKEEAQTFFKEVVNKYPKSDFFKSAQNKIKPTASAKKNKK